MLTFGQMFFRSLAPLALLSCAASATAATVAVTRSATCGCCKHWVEHMRKAGFTVTETVAQIPLARRTPLGWVLGFLIAFALLMGLQMALGKLVLTGIGIWGNNVPVGWAFDIINFVWWIGIGHAGTLISAILLLVRQEWRTSINRFAEAMTLFAVACAGLYPLLHLGRVWVFYWLLPYPSTMGVWPQFRSALVWDVFAVLTYFTVSSARANPCFAFW